MIDAVNEALMRTTLSIDDDVLLAAKAMAQQQDRSIGEVISDLARRSMRKPQSVTVRNGIPLLPAQTDLPPITLDIVNGLRDESP
jgi:hypothetical protein